MPWNAPWNFVGDRIWTSLKQTGCDCLGNAFLIKIAFGFDEQGILGEHFSSSLLHLNPFFTFPLCCVLAIVETLLWWHCCGDPLAIHHPQSSCFGSQTNCTLLDSLFWACAPAHTGKRWCLPRGMAPWIGMEQQEGILQRGGQNPWAAAKADVVQQSLGSFLCFPEGN